MQMTQRKWRHSTLISMDIISLPSSGANFLSTGMDPQHIVLPTIFKIHGGEHRTDSNSDFGQLRSSLITRQQNKNFHCSSKFFDNSKKKKISNETSYRCILFFFFFSPRRSSIHQSFQWEEGYLTRRKQYLVEHYERVLLRLPVFFPQPLRSNDTREEKNRDLELSEVFMRIF